MPRAILRGVLAYAAYAFLSGFALFLLGFATFMYFENRKFGDNQFTMKLLPPPPAVAPGPRSAAAAAQVRAAPAEDWSAVPGPPDRAAAGIDAIPVRGTSASRLAGRA